MKRLQLPTAMLGLTVLLTACPQPAPPAASVSLTVALNGVSSAPIKVTNAGSGATLFDGTLDGSKVFTNLTPGTTVKVEAGTVNGYVTPTPQTVTLDASKTITVEYKVMPGTAVQPTRIQGPVSDLPTGAAISVLSQGSEVEINNKSAVTNGALDLSLTKAPASLFQLLPTGNLDSCQFTGTQSANPSIALFSEVTLLSSKVDYLGTVTEQLVAGGTVSGSQVARLYSDSAATVKGKLTCTFPDGSTGTVSLDVNLTAGWNAVEYAGSNDQLTIKTLGSGARSVLKAVRASPEVNITLASSVDFTSDADVSVAARIYQDGGYTGQISLSTDLPGLTIEPKTVNLTAATLTSQDARATATYLGRLGLNPQRLDTTLTFHYSGEGNLSGTPFQIVARDAAGKQVGGGYSSVSVTRPGLSIMLSPPDVQMYPSGSQDVYVYASSIGNYSGSVTYTLSGLPAGLSTQPVTTNLNGASYVTLKVVGDGSVKPGTYPITVTATSADKSASASGKLTVNAPTVNLSFSGYGLSVSQGESASVPVTVSTSNGFSGSTTVTLTDLPAGVTATPKTVVVTPGASTQVMVPVQASVDAALGNSTIKVSSPDLGQYSSPTATLSVRPARASLPVSGAVLGVTQATAGAWVATDGAFDSATNQYRIKVTRVSASGQALTSVSAPTSGYSSPRFIQTDGGVLVLGQDVATLVSDEGAVTTLPTPQLGSVQTMSNTTDSQGRVWFVRSTYSAGAVTSSLNTWTTATGEITPVNLNLGSAGSFYGNQNFFFSPNRQQLALIVPGYPGGIYRIETTTQQATKVETTVPASSAAISDNGTLWLSAYGALSRVNSDGTVTQFDGISTGELLGFDRKNTSTLWGRDTSGVYRLETGGAKPISTFISLLNVRGAALNADGGTLAVWSEDYSGTASISLIK
ncbi:hypothetical protein [Deinococcus radiotolerans]|uniref:Uncharacterized protein n=1 Tax=Deinococcus radiotolerans TaxID=1309407 RepID=A0ABQ2FFM2_9DEIO|nr:hypothetical protein [Deinococcus radiotolerans]GGK85860.1 hypothetical protein GCM10010844_00480 [Deinococcus radiotolerans]